jgi:serine phosphatase RsbU (regulator of sigma subunit)
MSLSYSEPAARIRLTLSHAYRSPADPRRAGGDFALSRTHRDGTFTLMLADLWAKAAEAQHYAHRLACAFDSVSQTVHSPARLLARMNSRFVDELQSLGCVEGSASAFAFTCDLRGNLSYAAAGTDAAILFRGPHRHEHFEPTGPLLGLRYFADYYNRYVSFRRGDVLVACTDGITEARNRNAGGEQLGTYGLATIVRKLHRQDALPDCDDVMAHVARWIGDDFQDDATAVCIGALAAD